MYVANPIVADFDADGRLEVAFTPWYDLWMLDLETGNLEQKCKYQHPDAESGRAYGYLGAHDLFGDKRLEIVMLSNSELHMDVFGWDENGQLKIVWSRLIQRGVGHKEKRLQVMRDPVRDIDGDGKPEIVVAIYNRDGKGRWRTEVVDPETGKARYDLDNQCVIDLIDLDGDGACELFCLQSDQMEPLEWNRISIVQCRGGKARILWTKDLAAFETARRLGFPPHYRTNANWVLPQLLTGVLDQGRRPLFITRRLLDPETRHMELTLWRMDSEGKIESLASVSGPELKGRAIASSDSAQAGAVLVPQDVRRLSELGAAQIISLYVTKPGGLHPAMQVASAAQSHGMTCDIGGSIEMGIGVAANLHLGVSIEPLKWASVCPLPNVNGQAPVKMAGIYYQDDIIQTPIHYEDGNLYVPTGPGLGVEVDEEKLSQYAL